MHARQHRRGRLLPAVGKGTGCSYRRLNLSAANHLQLRDYTKEARIMPWSDTTPVCQLKHASSCSAQLFAIRRSAARRSPAQIRPCCKLKLKPTCGTQTSFEERSQPCRPAVAPAAQALVPKQARHSSAQSCPVAWLKQFKPDTGSSQASMRWRSEFRPFNFPMASCAGA